MANPFAVLLPIRRNVPFGLIHLLSWIFLCLLCASSALAVIPPAITPRISIDQPVSGFAVEDAFGSLQFREPVLATSPPGETNRLFVLERGGALYVITNLAAPNKTMFLDLRSSTSDADEGGLLGLAFHPAFATNGYFFVFRTCSTGGFFDQISRFKISASDPNQGDPNSELVLISQPDLSPEHNAGGMEFGPDGYLYASFGDLSPPSEDVPELGQAIDKSLLGSIVRIDVDKKPGNLAPNPHRGASSNYSIPIDNPWIGATNFLGQPVDPAKVRTELYAIGFRNAWRIAFDSLTGKLIAGDVGGGAYEEVDDVVKGGNYGWPFWEGPIGGAIPLPPGLETIPPVHAYPHIRNLSGGNVIIGGVICRNISIPQLEGKYVFGDGRMGNIWTLDPALFGQPNAPEPTWICSEPGAVSYCRDPSNGDLLMININTGKIRRMIYVAPDNQRIPQKLSDSGLFADLSSLAPANGLIPYVINAPFWSDNAIKRRWFGLTDPSKKIGFAAETNWTFPSGSVWVKHFDLEMVNGDPNTARRVETRVLVKNDTGVYGFTYRWNDSQTDALLSPSAGEQQTFSIIDGGQVRTQVWLFPARANCNTCHTAIGGYALGFNTAQLNLTNASGVNQLDAMDFAGYFEHTPGSPEHLRQLANPRDESQPLEYRVKSYVSANCSQCHQPGGPWGVYWDARLTTPMADAAIINGYAGATFNGPTSRIIAPHSLENSMIYYRVTHNELERMPPLGSNVLDDRAGQMLADWIMTLPDADWKVDESVPGGPLRGSLAQRPTSFVVTGTGEGADSFSFSHRTLSNNFQITARLKNIPLSNPDMAAGLRLAGENGAFVSIISGADRKNIFRTRDEAGLETQFSSNDPDAIWKRLAREGDVVSAWESRDGANWKQLAAASVNLPNLVEGGFSISSGNSFRYATAEYDSFNTTTIKLEQPPNATVPTAVWLNATLSTYGQTVRRVDFFADDSLIGSRSAPPWQIAWTNAMAGQHELRAAAVDAEGLTISSEPVPLTLAPNRIAATFFAETNFVDTHWIGRFGNAGYALPLYCTNLPALSELTVSGAQADRWTQSWPAIDDLSGGLLASAWYPQTECSLSFKPSFEDPYSLTLLLAEYLNETASAQVTIVSANNQILDQRVIQNLGGKYLTWIARGPVAVKIRNLSSAPVYVGGLFFDPIQAADITLTTPSQAQSFTLPTNVILHADAIAHSLPVVRVEFYDRANLIGNAATPPYEAIRTNSLAGDHVLTARAIGPFGPQSTSAPVRIHFELPSSTVAFVGTDTNSHGGWTARYGGESFALANGPWNVRSPVRVTLADDIHIYDSPFDSILAGLHVPGADWTLTAYWVANGSLNFDVELLDGREHTVALYLANFEGPNLPEAIHVLDLTTGEILDERFVDDVTGGIYFVWKIRGAARFAITPRDEFAPPAFSGLFVGGPFPPAFEWWARQFGDSSIIEPDWNADPDHDGRPNLMEYAAGSDPNSPDAPLALSFEQKQGSLFVKAPITAPPSDLSLRLEHSADLATWIPLDSPPAQTEANTLQFTVPIDPSTTKFFRLRVDLRLL